AGIDPLIMTGTGSTIILSQVSIFISIHIGDITTKTIFGTDTAGTINGFLINDFIRTGGVGKRINPGEDKKIGVSRGIHLEHKHTLRR
ncbi:MAG: hypothetical protein ACXU99_07350, partial [Thermodesulfobacteriota bacterium]